MDYFNGLDIPESLEDALQPAAQRRYFNGLDIPESLEDALQPAALALLVYDMQAGILAQVPDRDRVLANVLRLLAAARARTVRTIFLRHYFMPTALAGVFQLRQAKIWQRRERAADTRPLIPYGSPGFELVPELEPGGDEAVIDKITMSAFEGTPEWTSCCATAACART